MEATKMQEIPMLIKDTATNYSGSLSEYTPFENASNRQYWSSLPEALVEEIITAGETALSLPIPAILASTFMMYKNEGDRVTFENLYFARRHMLNDLVMAECVEYKGRFVNKIIDLIWAICEETSWVLPAHNSYIRDSENFILPISTKPVLDLFACETGAQLATIRYLLSDSLSSVSTIITERIDNELRTKIINPYLNEHFWWMGNGDEPMCNWTAWCTSNVLLVAFMTSIANEEDLRIIFEKSAASLDLFIKDYGDDGCCDEGAHYYRHAGLCLFSALDILNNVSNGAFESVFQLDKIKNIAAFIYHMNISGPYYFNFADCACKSGYSGAREYLFGLATNQKFLSDYAKQQYIQSLKDNVLLTDESVKLNLFYRVQQIITSKDILNSDTDNSSEKINPLTDSFSYKWYESVGVWINKNDKLALAVKAGDNDDSHNHNDAGSFILYKDNKPVFIDIGVGVYTAKTFSKDRYDIWTMQSSYHNLPTIMGCDEKAGANYHVSNLDLQESNETNVISMNLATAYDVDNIDYQRTISFDKSANEVSLTDKTNASQVVLNFITYFEPKVNDSELLIGDCRVVYEGATLQTIEELEINDDRLKQSWDKNLYRIQLRMSDTFKMIIK